MHQMTLHSEPSSRDDAAFALLALDDDYRALAELLYCGRREFVSLVVIDGCLAIDDHSDGARLPSASLFRTARNDVGRLALGHWCLAHDGYLAPALEKLADMFGNLLLGGVFISLHLLIIRVLLLLLVLRLRFFCKCALLHRRWRGSFIVLLLRIDTRLNICMLALSVLVRLIFVVCMLEQLVVVGARNGHGEGMRQSIEAIGH